MALAYLWAKFQKMFPQYKVADYPAGPAHAIVVDHCLRPESSEESIQVVRRLNKMGYKAMRTVIRWREVRKQGLEPHDLPNIESMARTLRYQQLAKRCRQHNVAAIFTAHHEDDQYETLLMRLISGHGYRGVTGIKDANDIPECHGLYKAHKSGLLEDQRSPHPYLNFNPSVRAMRILRSILKEDKLAENHTMLANWKSIDAIHFHGHFPRVREPGVPYLTPLECEDGGITIYRPLLGFSKDRLIATCEANKIPWFEDPTNVDETMTLRNAVRHLVRNHTLPEALQKPAVLSLSARARRRVDLEEAEARRLLKREAVIKDFDSCAGTLVVEMPNFTPKRLRRNRLYTSARIEARKPRQKLIAALVVRNLIDYVTPNEHLPPLGNLDSVVYRLFPELSPADSPSKPTAFSIGGVLFDPIVTQHSIKWFLSRAPYPSKAPLPEQWTDWREMATTKPRIVRKFEKDPQWSGWRRFQTPRLWDGRYWVQIHSLAADRIHILPFKPEHMKAFRKALPYDQRQRLEAILKHYAPGKVRYTLPAIYKADVAGLDMQSATVSMTLLALPTLGIHLPGLEKSLDYEVSYKKVDLSLLGLKRRGLREPLRGFHPSFSLSRRHRNKRNRLRQTLRWGGAAKHRSHS
jgi:tRNA(Ile)-lysidine synthase TilS/MesJ